MLVVPKKASPQLLVNSSTGKVALPGKINLSNDAGSDADTLQMQNLDIKSSGGEVVKVVNKRYELSHWAPFY